MRRLLTLAALTTTFVVAMIGVALAADVAIEDEGLKPTRIVVDVREGIVWTNNTDQPVSLVGQDPGWESGEIAPGATFSIEITQEGTYSYGSQDGDLSGQIVVREGGGGGNRGDGEGGEGDGQPVEEEDEGNAASENENEGDDDPAIDPNEEALPQTGVNAVVPGGLSLLLMAIGAGLLLVTHPERALRR